MRHEVLRTFHIFDKGKARDCRETPEFGGLRKGDSAIAELVLHSAMLATVTAEEVQ
jgi:hypothetical protein